MEFEVRVVGVIESCFVSLPLILIQTLQQTHSPPSFLALELRSRNSDNLWHVAWSGFASSSSAIEIAQHYAECIRLLDHTTVLVRAVANLPKATLVTIEPNTEDDWEILELNSEYAEEAFLKQVGIVHEAMRFPLWLRGQTTITFLVVSTFPKNPIVHVGRGLCATYCWIVPLWKTIAGVNDAHDQECGSWSKGFVRYIRCQRSMG